MLANGGTPLCHLAAIALFETGLPAFIVPSAANPTGSNIVIFPENLRPKDRLEAKGLDSVTKH